MSSPNPKRTRKIIIRVIALVLALVICGVLYDLYFPRTTHLRDHADDDFSGSLWYYAANAAFVFKQGKQRADYEKALPDLVKFYRAIRQMSDIPFDCRSHRAAGTRVVDHSSPARAAAG